MSVQIKPVTLKDFVISTLVGIAPVIIVVLMSKPALRQQIKMQIALVGRNMAVAQMGFWQDAAFKMARVYDRARL